MPFTTKSTNYSSQVGPGLQPSSFSPRASFLQPQGGGSLLSPALWGKFSSPPSHLLTSPGCPRPIGKTGPGPEFSVVSPTYHLSPWAAPSFPSQRAPPPFHTRYESHGRNWRGSSKEVCLTIPFLKGAPRTHTAGKSPLGFLPEARDLREQRPPSPPASIQEVREVFP